MRATQSGGMGLPAGAATGGLEQDAKASVASAMSDLTLILRPARSRKRGERQHDDYGVFDGDRDVGRIYLVHSEDRSETWFWGVSFRVTNRKSYGYAVSLEEAKAGFRAEYDAWKGTAQSGPG